MKRSHTRTDILWNVTCALVLVAPAALAQTSYPDHPIRLIAPAAPGTGTDVVARMLAQGLSERLGQAVVAENRTGAGNLIANEMVAKAAPDGYMLLLGGSALTINPSMYKKMSHDALRDLAPITQAVFLPSLLVVHPSLPAKSTKALIALAKLHPAEILFGSAGHGTNSHLSAELFAMAAQIRIVHVPYKSGSLGLPDLMAGRIAFMMPNMIGAIPHVRSGRLRGLGVTSAVRVAAAPEIPTIAEGGLPGWESVQWYGLLTAAKTPREIIARLHKEAVATLNVPKNREILASDGGVVVAGSPEEFETHIKAETAKWAKAVKAAGIEPQ